MEIRSRHFWQLDFGQLVGTVDVRVRRDADEQNVLTLVTDKMSSVVSMLTVQIVKDAAWHTVEGINATHVLPSYDDAVTHGHGHEHGDGHGHSHGAENADHSHDHSSANHGHSHDHGGHGHSHDGSSHGMASHGSAPRVEQLAGPYGNPTNQQSAYNIPPVYGASHGHSHDGVTYH
ncbi:unnamed protein product [Heligmosomoides polygyrus]|uniref:Uncharacterized protein n=1 Tax=Heligmosomoides polygyrus TaxID=6339 RepID=A0A3P8D7N0_HELPZ|nr:unnamed protein product [Heligmosomoides polygyrus]